MAASKGFECHSSLCVRFYFLRGSSSDDARAATGIHKMDLSQTLSLININKAAVGVQRRA
jgi:hypothetical protein